MIRSSRLVRPLLAFATLAGLASGLQAGPVTPFITVAGTDLATGGVAMRGIGSGVLPIAGVTGAVTQSYLWWHGPTNSANPAANANVTVNGNPVVGTNIGIGFDNFWGNLNSQAYRANTTAIINGNGNYNLSNFQKPDALINGAASAVFFNDGSAANNRDVAIFNGNDSNFAFAGPPVDPAGWSFTLSNINYSGGQAFLRLFVSDGQNFGANDDGTLRINGTMLTSGGIFQGNTLLGPSVGNGNLYDIRSFDITSFLTPGINNLTVTLDAGFADALSANVALVDLPAGALVAIPEPSSVMACLIGLGVLGARLRRKRS